MRFLLILKRDIILANQQGLHPLLLLIDLNIRWGMVHIFRNQLLAKLSVGNSQANISLQYVRCKVGGNIWKMLILLLSNFKDFQTLLSLECLTVMVEGKLLVLWLHTFYKP
jgi:hypothetical protein